MTEISFRFDRDQEIKEMARLLVEQHHYSGVLPVGTMAAGIFFTNDGPLAACCFGPAPARAWTKHPIRELNRLVRAPGIKDPNILTSLISKSVKAFRREFPSILLLVSYADALEGHHGGIYQAASWNYGGFRDSMKVGVSVDEEFYHARTCNSRWNTSCIDDLRELMPDSAVEPVYDVGKFVYWKPLRRGGTQLAEELGLKVLPYPKPSVLA